MALLVDEGIKVGLDGFDKGPVFGFASNVRSLEALFSGSSGRKGKHFGDASELIIGW